jgi:hypothetical protein
VRDLAVLFLHLLATVARLVGPGGARSVVAESVLVKHQLLILNRSRKRSPNLRVSDRMVAGLCALLMRPGRLIRSAIVVRPSTLLSLHRTLTQRKYRRLFSSKVPTKPGPKGPSQEVIAAAGESAHVYNECPGYLPELGTPGFFAGRDARRGINGIPSGTVLDSARLSPFPVGRRATFWPF